MEQGLPHYDRPPLNEVLFSFQFKPLRQLQAALIGLYWQGIRDRYPVTEDQGPIPHTIEGPSSPPQSIGLTTPQPVGLLFQGGPINLRCWFRDQDHHRLIQLQQDRFIRNWQVQGDAVYPRFKVLAAEYKEEWSGFLSFLSSQEIQAPVIDQCELTYVNHIDIDLTPEKGFSQLPRVFPSMGAITTGGFLPAPEAVQWQLRYLLPESRGRLFIDMNPAFRASDMKFVLVLTLTARGAPASESSEDAFEWFDLAHEWIVRSFNELTGPDMHKSWGKRDE